MTMMIRLVVELVWGKTNDFIIREIDMNIRLLWLRRVIKKNKW